MSSLKTKIIGEYRVLERLGKGGSGEVFAAEHLRLGSAHAIKFFSTSAELGASVVADLRLRFETEGKLLARLRHPRVVRVSDYGVEQVSNTPYFVMDRVLSPDGTVKTLADILPEEIDESRVGMWYEDIREGLEFLHGNGIIHRDLKLENVLVGPDGHAVIADLGVSRLARDIDGVNPVKTVTLAADGCRPVMFTAGYAAPELRMGAPASAAGDFYALGIIVLRLLTGLWYDEQCDLEDILEGYSPEWREILPALLHVNPRARVCAKYYAERDRLRMAMEVASEKKLLGALVKARRFAIFAIVAMVVSLGVIIWAVSFYYNHAHSLVYTFDDLFALPPEHFTDQSWQEAREEIFGIDVEFDQNAITLIRQLNSGFTTPTAVAAKFREWAEDASDEESELYRLAAQRLESR